jgi:hypothetical protein
MVRYPARALGIAQTRASNAHFASAISGYCPSTSMSSADTFNAGGR